MVGFEVIKSPPQGAGGGQRAIASGGRGWGLGFWRSEAAWYSSPPREWGGAASCRTDRPERPSARGEDGRRERGAGGGEESSSYSVEFSVTSEGDRWQKAA